MYGSLPSKVRGGFSQSRLLDISPDGTKLAVVATKPDGSTAVFLRRLGDPSAGEVRGTDGATHASFSPDGDALLIIAAGQLRVVPVIGGRATVLADSVNYAHWGEGDRVVFVNGRGVWLTTSNGRSYTPFPEDGRMSSTGKDLAQVIGREIERVAEEIAAYRDERNLWVTQGTQRNAPGTLALHLAGNVRHYVGAGLGGTGYVRDQHAEFHDRDVPREELLSRLRLAGETAVDVLTVLDEETFAEGRFAVDLPDAYADMTVRAYLVHLAWHLGWHQGQIYYHRLSVEPPEVD